MLVCFFVLAGILLASQIFVSLFVCFLSACLFFFFCFIVCFIANALKSGHCVIRIRPEGSFCFFNLLGSGGGGDTIQR